MLAQPDLPCHAYADLDDQADNADPPRVSLLTRTLTMLAR